MLADPTGEVDGLDQLHTHDVGVEVDRTCHILAHHRDVVEASNFEFAIGIFHRLYSTGVADQAGCCMD